MRKNKSLIGGIVAAIAAILVFVGSFYLANKIIYSIANLFQGHDARLACVVVLWIVSCTVVFYIAALITGIVFGLVKTVLD